LAFLLGFFQKWTRLTKVAISLKLLTPHQFPAQLWNPEISKIP
jgi:hypothetical protein